MLIKFNCLMPVLAAFIVSQKVNFCKRSESCRSRFVAVVCSLKCFENDLVCCQLIKGNKTFASFTILA